MMQKYIKNITKKNFEPYGYIIDYDQENRDDFQVVLTEAREKGWRIAFSKIIDSNIIEIARHPETMETFEPIHGTTLICVSTTTNINDYQIFLLDRPICIKQNIWHTTICLSDYSIVKIIENAEVTAEKHKIEEQIDILMRNNK